MKDDFYKRVIEESPTGYAFHKIICDTAGVPCDYEFIEVNAAFEKLTGLKASDIKGRKITEVLPKIKEGQFDVIALYGDIAIHGGKKEIEEYSEALDKWYKIKVYSPKKYYFITHFIDITKEKEQLKKLVQDKINCKQAEEMLKESEEKYRRITENISDVVWSMDINLRPTYASPSIEKLLGVSVDTYLKQTLKDMYPQDSLNKINTILLEEFEKEKDPKSDKGRTRLIEVERYKADGTTIWIAMHIGFIRDKNGKAIGFQGTTRDITDRKKTQEALRKSDKKYRLIFEKAPLGFFYFNSKGIITDCNENFVKIIGSSREKLVGLNILKLQDKKMVEVMGDALEGQVTYYEGNYQSVTADKLTYLRIMYAPIFSEENEIEGVTGIVEDISYRKQMEEMIYIEKERLKTTLLSIGDGVISTDNQGRVLLLNRVAEYLTGWKQEEAFGKSFKEVFNIVNEFSRKKCKNPVNQVLETGETIELAKDTILISKDGTEWPIEDSAAAIRTEDNKVNGVVLVFRDVTESKEKQARIEHLSFHDQLTGLYNRMFFEEELKRLDTERSLPLTLAILDVNGLKLINDAFGHLVGDQVLQGVSKVMKKECREDDIVARIGGDEFVILLPKTNSKQAEILVKRIYDAINNEQVVSINLSVSCGWETKQEKKEEIMKIFKKAEENMYRRKLSESTSMRHETIKMIIKTLHEKNPREQQHSERVSQLCGAIGEGLKLSQEDISELRTLGSIHDIGKITLDERILDKPGALTDVEWSAIRRHPETGYQILSSVNQYAPFAEFVLGHHERWDGKGYPKGLQGEEIPFESRIIAVADAYDAMTSDRPYRKAMDGDTAILELKSNSGTQFDSNIVRVFVEKVLKNG